MYIFQQPVHNSGRAGSPMFTLIYMCFIYSDFSCATGSESDRLYYDILYWVCFTGSLYLGFWVWNSHITWVEAELWYLVLAGLQDSSECIATGNDRDCKKDIPHDLYI